MSCENHHEMPCDQVLDAVFLYLDQELVDQEQAKAIAQHLEECPPCGDQYQIQERVQQLLSRCIQDDECCPETVRQRVMERITTLRIEMSLEVPPNH